MNYSKFEKNGVDGRVKSGCRLEMQEKMAIWKRDGWAMPLKNRTHHLKASCFLRGAVSRANCLRSRPEHRRAMNELAVAAAAAAAAKSLQSCPTLCDPIDGSPLAPSSLGFSRREHWSGLPFPSPMHASEKWKWSRSVMSDSLWPHGLQPARLLCPWDFPGKRTGVGCHRLLQMNELSITEINKTAARIVWIAQKKIWL